MIRLKYALTEEKGERDMSDSKRRLWTIPNVLTLIRLILVPVYWVLMLGYHLDYWALGASCWPAPPICWMASWRGVCSALRISAS